MHILCERLETSAAWVEVPKLSPDKLTMSSLILVDGSSENNRVATPGQTQSGLPLTRRCRIAI